MRAALVLIIVLLCSAQALATVYKDKGETWAKYSGSELGDFLRGGSIAEMVLWRDKLESFNLDNCIDEILFSRRHLGFISTGYKLNSLHLWVEKKGSQSKKTTIKQYYVNSEQGDNRLLRSRPECLVREK